MKRSTFCDLICHFFSVLFLYTAVTKLLDYNVAKEQLSLTPLLAPVAKEVVIGLPIVEILTAIFLFFPPTRKKALLATLALMISFTAYVVYILNYNDQLPCTCGGVLQQMSWSQHLFFNSACILLVVTAILLDRPIKISRRKDNNLAIRGSNI